MIVHAYRIPYKYGETIKIKPIFDVHYGNSNCNINAFKRYIEDSDENTYFFTGGDIFDSIIVSDTKRYKKSGDATSGDEILDEQLEGMVKMLFPYRGKIIGIGHGNHEEAILKRCSTNMSKRLVKELSDHNHKITFLGLSGLMKLFLHESKSRVRTCIIRYHHGWGGGSRTQGADLTKFSKDLQYWNADIFCYGHVHRRQDDRVPRLGIKGESKLYSRPKILTICGTYLKTYSCTTDATYSEVKGYPPLEIGGLTINLKPNQDWMDISVTS